MNRITNLIKQLSGFISSKIKTNLAKIKSEKFLSLIKHTAIGLVMLIAVIIICSMIGSQKISLTAVWSYIFGKTTDSTDYTILFQLRLPRCILAALVGASLAISGVVLQALLRNPLADPYILGISSGAGLGAMLAMATGLQVSFLGISSIGLFAFIGAIGTVWLVWWLGIMAGGRQVSNLLLAGVVVNAFFSAIIMFLSSIISSSGLQGTMMWLMGNVRDAGSGDIMISTICLTIALIVLFRISAELNALSFGQKDAQSMGVNVNSTRLIAFATTAFITSVAVSMSGLIGFIGLIVPHTVRLVIGPDHRRLLPMCGFAGAIFLVVCDTFARTIIAPRQLPVGIITAITGAPFFLVLLIKYSRKVSLGVK